MKRRALLLVLTCVVLVLGMASAATAATEWIWPWSPSEVVINSGDDIILFEAWGGPRGSVVSWQKNSYHEATIEEVGGPVVLGLDRAEAEDYMGDVEPMGIVDWAFNPHIKMPAFMCLWAYPVGVLPVGDYELVLGFGATHVAPDLFDGDGDGKPDVWTATDGWYNEAEITIHVMP